MAVSPCNDKLALLDAQEMQRLANRVASFTNQEMVDGVPAGRTRPSKNLEPWQCIGHPMEETRRLRSRENRRYTRQPLRCRQLFLREKRMTPCVSRARGPIDGHIAEQFEIMGDDRSFPAGYPALGNANYERIGILTAKIRTFRVEKWMLLVKGLCGLPRIFARRSPFGVTQPFPKWFAGGEMFKVGLRSGPDVRWAVWRQAENIPETAQQHVPDAKTPPQAVNKEALLDGGAPPWR